MFVAVVVSIAMVLAGLEDTVNQDSLLDPRTALLLRDLHRTQTEDNGVPTAAVPLPAI